MSLEAAQGALSETLRDLEKTFRKMNIQFKITFTPGTSNESRTQITSGAARGAINVFLYDNTRGAIQSGSYYNFESRQIFMVKVANSPFDSGALAHEMGNMFRHFVKGNPMTGINLPGKTQEGWCWCIDAANYTEDWAIDTTNARLREGNIEYGRDYVDDYSSVSVLQ